MTLPPPPLRQKPTKSSLGFSLIELLVVIAVLAITLAFAVPNMRQMVLNNRTKAAVNTLISGLQMARNEAITRNKNITFCPSNQAGNNCATSDNASQFQYGALLMDRGDVIQRIENMPNGVRAVAYATKIEFKKSGAVSNNTQFGKIDVTGQGDIKRTICIGAFGQISTKEGVGTEVKCSQ